MSGGSGAQGCRLDTGTLTKLANGVTRDKSDRSALRPTRWPRMRCRVADMLELIAGWCRRGRRPPDSRGRVRLPSASGLLRRGGGLSIAVVTLW